MRTVDETGADSSIPGDAGPTADATVHFRGLVIDGMPALLRQSYRLRYLVYCVERHFLPAENYPDGLEMDRHDAHSVHLAVLNSLGAVAATARLIERTDAGLPLFDHCSVAAHETDLHDPARRLVEISRLAVSRRYNRRDGDGFFALRGAVVRPGSGERRGSGDLMVSLYKAVYHVSKRRGFTHWIAATEKSLQRLLARYGFPFRAIGPETDYYGIVAPYLIDLRELDQIILSRRSPLLHGFLDGLEDKFRPVADEGGPHQAGER